MERPVFDKFNSATNYSLRILRVIEMSKAVYLSRSHHEKIRRCRMLRPKPSAIGEASHRFAPGLARSPLRGTTNWDDENSKKMDEIFAKMLVELDQDARYKLVQDWYNTFWEYVPYVKTIDYSRMNATNAKLQGYANYCQPFF